MPLTQLKDTFSPTARPYWVLKTSLNVPILSDAHSKKQKRGTEFGVRLWLWPLWWEPRGNFMPYVVIVGNKFSLKNIPCKYQPNFFNL